MLPSKRMAGRTCRVPAGTTLLIGGLARLDVLDHPGGTLYLTVFASAFVNLHIGGWQLQRMLLGFFGGVLGVWVCIRPPGHAHAHAMRMHMHMLFGGGSGMWCGNTAWGVRCQRMWCAENDDPVQRASACAVMVATPTGKTEGAEQRVQRHGGVLLSPPASPERFAQLPAWTPRDVVVEGTEWTKSSTDIHIAGLGWVAVGVKGQARLRVWVAPSVQVTKRPALVPDYAKEFIRPGFSSPLPKAPTIGQPGKSETEMNSSSSGCDGRQEQ